MKAELMKAELMKAELMKAELMNVALVKVGLTADKFVSVGLTKTRHYVDGPTIGR